MRHDILVFIAALVAAQPAAAQSAAKPVARPTPAEPALDPQRLALARQIIGAVVPDGTMQKMMSQMSGVRSGMMKDMFDKSPEDLGIKGAKKGDKSLGALVRERDPYFEERLAITNKVMMDEMGKIMANFEPQIRETMAQIYAKRFTLHQLTDIAAFFRSESGKVYGKELMPLMGDPEYTKMMGSMMPKIMQAMPGIMEKVQKATGQLPPPPTEDDETKAAVPPTT